MNAATTLPQTQPAAGARSRWNDPLGLIQTEAPAQLGRIVLWAICLLCLILFVWASIGKLDIVITADGKLTPQSLLKIVQPAQAGIVKEILVKEGDSVTAGQILARLDPTEASADKAGLSADLAINRMQERRIVAELKGNVFSTKAGDDSVMFAQVQGQYFARRKSQLDALDQERAMLQKAQSERTSAQQILAKLTQTLPIYQQTAQAYQKLEKEGFYGSLASAEKQRDAIEKSKDLDAQTATVQALGATIDAQNKRIAQIQSANQTELQKELADVRQRIEQLRPNLEKSNYREALMELKAPQAGTVKDLTTTTIGAVVQPGSVLLTLVPADEKLFADVAIKNEDIGFVQTGQSVQIKLAAFPFQKYGLIAGKVVHVSADASDPNQAGNNQPNQQSPAASMPIYKARIALEEQYLRSPVDNKKFNTNAGMQVAVEIHQGRRTVMEYLLSPVTKSVQEAGREK